MTNLDPWWGLTRGQKEVPVRCSPTVHQRPVLGDRDFLLPHFEENKMRPRRDMSGERIGMLTVVKLAQAAGTTLDGRRIPTKWECLCDCGTTCGIELSALNRGQKSCGCVKVAHGLSHHPLYVTWRNIKYRCTRETYFQYPAYGGRGITMDPKWVDSPEAFIADVERALGKKPTSKHSLDRIDNNRGYTLGNLRWATATQQQNNKRDNFNIDFNGVTKTLKEWSRTLGYSYIALHARLTRYGWSVQEAFTTPTEGKQRKRGLSANCGAV